MTNEEKFVAELEKVLRDKFANDPQYTYVATTTTPELHAAKMADALCRGELLIGGATKAACKSLGIKPRSMQIREYLNN